MKTFVGIDRLDYQLRRREFLRRHVDTSSTRGLEFGGFDLPTVPPSLGRCAIADMRSELQLSQLFDTPIEDIPTVDCIVEPGVTAYRQIGARFDYVILCHVLEHVPDVITMMNDLAELLVPGGTLFIALPDKRRTPDAPRHSTTVARLVERQLEHATVPSMAEIAECYLAWNEGFRDQYEKSMKEFFHGMLSYRLFGDPDVHCNVWQDEEFVQQITDLIRGDYITDLEIVGTQPMESHFNEFYVALKRPSSAKDESASVEPTNQSEQRPVHYRTCSFCGHGQFKVWKRIHAPCPERLYADSSPNLGIGRELSLQYLTCRKCDLSAINPLPSFETIDRHQFGVGNFLEDDPRAVDALIADRQRVIQIQSEQYDFERYRQTGRLLDVSCGPGVGLAWLRDNRSWDVRGVEPAREFVDFASRRFGLNIHNGLVQDMTEPDGSFDVIMLDSSLQYMFDPLQTLVQCHRLLREGGCLFLTVPNRDSLGSEWIDLNVQWGHWFAFSPPVLHRILDQIGFRSERILALQSELDPRVLEVMPASDVEEPLAVSLQSHAEIESYLDQDGKFRADFFGISATKLTEDECSESSRPSRATLDAISDCSRRHRLCVAIDPNTKVHWPWEMPTDESRESD